MGCIGKIVKNKKGQATVEFALVLPILLLLMFGIIDFGRVLNEYLVVTAAAREGARSAAVLSSDATVDSTVRQAASSLNTGGNALVITILPADRVSGTQVTVSVSHNVRIFTPLMQEFLPDPFTVTGTAVMRVE